MSDTEGTKLPEITTQRLRFLGIMRRHILSEDDQLTDDALVRAVFARYEAARGTPLIDPNE